MKNTFSLDIENALLGFAQADTNDIIILGVAFFSMIGFVASLVLYLRSQRTQASFLNNAQDLTGGLRGRLEKLEMNFNNSRTELVRADQFASAELIHIRKELALIKKHLGIKAELPEPEKIIPKTEEAIAVVVPAKEIPLETLAESTQKKTEKSEIISEEAEPLNERLKKTRKSFMERFRDLFKDRTELDDAGLDDLEEMLIAADIGVKTSQQLLNECRHNLQSGQRISRGLLMDSLRAKIGDILKYDNKPEYPLNPVKNGDFPVVVLMIGVNGVGKTTTTAKLAYLWKKAGKKVVMAAADTFRAAAVEQLLSWGKQMDVPVVTGPENCKPATVVFDALDKAIQEQADVVLIDTAGRLHNKANLMQELEGIKNVVSKKYGRLPDETILVVDAATGQNALSQAREFNSVSPLSGIIVTKLDGTPKGGIVIAIKAELGIPVRYIGVGESKLDLRVFNSSEFASALLNEAANNATEPENTVMSVS